MTSAKVVKKSVAVTDKSPSQDFPSPGQSDYTVKYIKLFGKLD